MRHCSPPIRPNHYSLQPRGMPFCISCISPVRYLFDEVQMSCDFYPIFILFTTACTKFYSFSCVAISLDTRRRPVLGPTHPPIQWTPVVVLSETKQTDLEASNLPPHSDSTKNTWSSTSIVHLRQYNIFN